MLCCDKCLKDLGKAPEGWPKSALTFCDGGCEYQHFLFITGTVQHAKNEGPQ